MADVEDRQPRSSPIRAAALTMSTASPGRPRRGPGRRAWGSRQENLGRLFDAFYTTKAGRASAWGCRSAGRIVQGHRGTVVGDQANAGPGATLQFDHARGEPAGES